MMKKRKKETMDILWYIYFNEHTASSRLNLCAFFVLITCVPFYFFIFVLFCCSLLLLLKFNFTMKTLINCSFNALFQLPFVHFQTRHEVNRERASGRTLSLSLIPSLFLYERKNRKKCMHNFLCVCSLLYLAQFFVQLIYKLNKNLFARQRGNSASTHWILIKSTS